MVIKSFFKVDKVRNIVVISATRDHLAFERGKKAQSYKLLFSVEDLTLSVSYLRSDLKARGLEFPYACIHGLGECLR